jgi:hypothetical protein
MSEDYCDDAVHAGRWVTQGRELQREAFDIAFEMTDTDAWRHMLFVAESYHWLLPTPEPYVPLVF